MLKSRSYQFNAVKLIEEVKKHPGLYDNQNPAERDEKILLWREVGAALYTDWNKFNKATVKDRVLTLQRKWRCLRDAYNRELRGRRTGVRTNRREYVYFKRMQFLGGSEGLASDHEDLNEDIKSNEDPSDYQEQDPLRKPNVKRAKKKRRKMSTSSDSSGHQETNTAAHIETPDEGDSDRSFLLSFLPVMKQLHPSIKMWARAGIASVMQEAVAFLYDESQRHRQDVEVKSQGSDSSE